jgi:large conductance mechanosensitive channel
MIIKKYFQEFKEFSVKGNAIDLAVGVIIGGAFGKIVSSLVTDIVMPPIGVLLGGVNFSDIKITLKQAMVAAGGVAAKPAVSINIGLFLQNVLDFFIVAVAVFFMVKVINRLKRPLKQVIAEVASTEPVTEPVIASTKDQELLTEIRDLLVKKSGS